MSELTIYSLPDVVLRKLCVRAAQNGCSLQEEVRRVLTRAVIGPTGPELLRLAETHFGKTHGIELALPL